MVKKYLFFIFLIFVFYNANAQNTKVEVELKNKKIVIGQQTEIILKADVSASETILFPILQDSVNKYIEIVETGQIDTTFTKGNQRFLLSQIIKVTSFDSGQYVIKPFVFLLNGKDSLKTKELLLNVQTIAVDTTEKSLKDIHSVYDTPLTFREFIAEYKYWILSVFLLLAGVILMVLYLKYWRKKPTEIEKIKPEKKIPPHILAIEKLEKLKTEKLWQNGKVKQYYTELTDILRWYIEVRFVISTGEQTSSEIIESCKQSKSIENERIIELSQIFTFADLAKFAKSEPLPDENDLAFAKTLNFVQQTKESVQISENVKTQNV